MQHVLDTCHNKCVPTAHCNSNNFLRATFQNNTDGVRGVPACYVWGDNTSQAAVRAVPVARQAPAQRPSSVSAVAFSRRADWRSKRIVVREKAVMRSVAEISAYGSWTSVCCNNRKSLLS